MQRSPLIMVHQPLPQWHNIKTREEVTKVEPIPPITKRLYDIVPVRPENYEDAMNFLRRNFFRDEPLNVYLNLVPTSEPGACPELEDFTVHALKQGVSLMAVNSNGSIVGLCVNGVSHPSDVEELQDLAKSCPNEKFKIILGLLAHVEKESNAHERFGVDSIFELPILSVDACTRGQGVATTLFNESVELAKKLKYPAMRVDCTSEFTARAASKLGFQKIYSLRYEDYKRPGDIEPPLKPAKPHDEVKAYAIKF